MRNAPQPFPLLRHVLRLLLRPAHRLFDNAMFAVARRMRAKGPAPNISPQQSQQFPQQPMAGLPAMSDQEEQLIAKRQVYFLTFPHPHVERSKDGVQLVAPGSLSREDICVGYWSLARARSTRIDGAAMDPRRCLHPWLQSFKSGTKRCRTAKHMSTTTSPSRQKPLSVSPRSRRHC